MIAVREYRHEQDARAAIRLLATRDIPAEVAQRDNGRFAVLVPGAYRSLAGDVLGSARDRRSDSNRSRIRREYRLPVPAFVLVSGVAIIVFLVWFGADAPGGRAVFVLMATTIATLVGLWFVAPDFYEVESMRMLGIEFLAGGMLIVLAYRVVFDLLPVGSAPYRGYPPWEWLAGSLLLQGAVSVVSASIARRAAVRRVRQMMILFGVTGLAVGIVASATYMLDLGYTAERWGLVSVWAVIGIYPILSIPVHALAAGILGWGWALTARSKRKQPFVVALLTVSIAFGIYDYAVVRSPFWGPLAVLGLVVVWLRLFALNPENAPMVQRIPQSLVDEYGQEHP